MRPGSSVLVAAAILAVLMSCEIVSPDWPEPSSRGPAQDPPRAGRTRLVDMTHFPGLDRLYTECRAERGIIVGSFTIDRDQDGFLDDPVRFDREFQRLVPPGFTGIVALDWEHQMTAWLKRPEGSPELGRAVRHLTDLVVTAKRLRPKAQIGYYGMPLAEYWKRDEAWEKRSAALVDMFRHADWVAPAIYNIYRTGDQQPVARQRKFAEENLRQAFELAKRAGDKPVYAFITHRFHGANDGFAWRRVPEAQMRDNVGWILDAERGGRRVEAVIWWAADLYYNKNGTLPERERTDQLRVAHERTLRLLASMIRDAG